MSPGLARRLDVGGLLAVLPQMQGDTGLAPAAEVLRLSVVGGILNDVSRCEAAGTPADDLVGLWGGWLAGVLAAPTDATWWVQQPQPVTAHRLACRAASITRTTASPERTTS